VGTRKQEEKNTVREEEEEGVIKAAYFDGNGT
jgi:hypothetical protein